jgi:hypothetical protein
VQSSCEHGNAHSGSVKWLGNSGVSAGLVASHEGLSSMESACSN